MVTGERYTEVIKRHHQSPRMRKVREKMESMDTTLSPDLLRLVNQAKDKGASSWLSAEPVVDQGLALNEQEFRYSVAPSAL